MFATFSKLALASAATYTFYNIGYTKTLVVATTVFQKVVGSSPFGVFLVHAESDLPD